MTPISRMRALRHIYSVDDLPMPRAFMHGPKWRRHFEVQAVPIAVLSPALASFHRPGRTVLTFSFETDVRELVLEQLRPGVFAEWSDPRERFTAARRS